MRIRRILSGLAALALSAAGLGASALTATPALAATGCSVAYTEPSVWNTGFTASLNVTNSGTTSITGWTVTLTYAGNPQIQSGSGWNGTWSQTGETVTITNLSYNGSLAPGASATGIGANFNYSGTHTPASSVTCTPAGGSTGNTVTVTNPGPQTTTIGTAVSLAIKATDSGSGQTLAYSATGLPTGLSINSSTGVVTGTPTTAQTASVTITAKDGTGVSGTATFTWAITAGNTVTVTNPGPQTTTVGTAVSLAIKATDSGSGQTLAYSATGLPTGLSINSSTGVVTGTPTTAQTASVTITAKDGTGVSGTATFTWTINPVNTSGAPQLHVSGNKLLDGNGNTVILRGVNRSGAEYQCVEGKGIFDGEVDQAAITAMKSWKVNAVRVPLNEACWNGESYVNASFAGTNYINAVKSFVSLLNSNGLDVILDLHWTDGDYTGNANAAMTCTQNGGPENEAFCQKPMPDAAQAIPFWTSVANTFKGNNSVLFDLFNEPFIDQAAGATAGWTCWLNGGTCSGITYQVAGMQAMVNAVRGTGASNVIMLGGVTWSNDLTQWLAHEPTDPDHNLVASWHSYNFNACSNQSCWTSQIAPVIAQVPVIAGEIGENDCAGGYITPLTTWLDSQNTSYLAWAWNSDFGCSSGPGLVTDYVPGDPTAYGAAYKSHLASVG